MKLLQIRPLVLGSDFPDDQRQKVEATLKSAVKAVKWPPGNNEFVIRPLADGNGVAPLKNGFMDTLLAEGWRPQQRYPRSDDGSPNEVYPGAFDAWLDLPKSKAVVLEWETGNVSSSHRSINRMARAIMEGHAIAGYLVVPSRTLYNYLTQRIGNFLELSPYFPLWEKLPLGKGFLGVVEVEFDRTDPDVQLIPKGKDGRALKAVEQERSTYAAEPDLLGNAEDL